MLERLSDAARVGPVAGPHSNVNARGESAVKRPMSAAGQRRPTSDFAKLASAMGDMNPR